MVGFVFVDHSIGEILCGGPSDSATLALIPTLIVFPREGVGSIGWAAAGGGG